MKFNLDNYKDTYNIGYAMHCKTKDEAIDFYRVIEDIIKIIYVV